MNLSKLQVIKAEIDVIGLLLAAQTHNAQQLAGFCRHYISTNFQLMQKRAEFKNLTGENLEYVEKNQWPPVSYFKELEAYEKAVGKTNVDPACVVM